MTVTERMEINTFRVFLVFIVFIIGESSVKEAGGVQVARYMQKTPVVKLALSSHLDVASGDPLYLLHHRAGLHTSQQRPWCSGQVTAALRCVHCTSLWLLLLLLSLLAPDSAWKGLREPA